MYFKDEFSESTLTQNHLLDDESSIRDFLNGLGLETPEELEQDSKNNSYSLKATIGLEHYDNEYYSRRLLHGDKVRARIVGNILTEDETVAEIDEVYESSPYEVFPSSKSKSQFMPKSKTEASSELTAD